MLRRHWRLITVLVFSLGLACLVEHRVFWDSYAINNDVRNQAYWMNRLINPNLYPQDLAAQYFTQPALVSPLVYWIYRLASDVIDPIRFSQFLPFALVLLSTFCLFKAAQCYVNARYAFWVSILFNLVVWMMSDLTGGLPRAFCFPLLFLFLWVLHEKRWGGVLITCVLQSLTYPPILFLSLGLLLFHVCKDAPLFFRNRKQAFLFILTLCLSAAVLIQRYVHVSDAQKFGALMRGSVAENMQEFYEEGRVPIFLFHPSPLPEGTPLEEVNDFLIRIPPWNQMILLFSILFSIVLYQKFLSRVIGPLLLPKDFWPLAIVSFLLYFSASFLLFFLYVPDRYLEYTLPLLAIFFIGGVLQRIEEKTQKRPVLIIGFILLGLWITHWVWRDDLIKVYSNQKQLFTYLEHLPVDARIAASYPIIANDIPVFSKRSVLVNREVSVPFHSQYYGEMKNRLRDWIEAYYTQDSQVLQNFVKKYKIDDLVISTRDFDENRFVHLLASCSGAFPKSWLFQVTQTGNGRPFLLQRLAPSCQAFTSGPYSVIPASAVFNRNCFLQ